MVERRWSEDVLAVLADAVTQSSSGTPTTLVVEAEPGIGKSALLDELVARAAGFTVARSETYETSAAVPYDVLARWGVDVAETAAPRVAAQRLRSRVDVLAERGPVLLILDDLQWSDPESTEAVIDLMSRLAGDRLLLAVAQRPAADEGHPAWQRWTSRPGRVVRVPLASLSLDDALALIGDLKADIDAETAEALWRHTSGNPMFLTALLDEYAPAELAQRQVLPAPSGFSRTVSSRLQRLDPSARKLIEALAVLGSEWTPLIDATVVAQTDAGSLALQGLLDAGLAKVRTLDSIETVRVEHVLVRSAVYQTLPLSRRKQLHARAALIVSQRQAVLEHRLAAAERYDDNLADDLAAYAKGLHVGKSYRLAAHYWRAASIVTSDRVEAEKRWLEALFDTLVSGDRDSVRAALPQVRGASDVVRRGFTEGALALWSRRPHEAVRLLGPLVEGGGVAMDPATQYRIEVVLAWSRLQCGESAELAGAGLARAAWLKPQDSAIKHLELLAAGALAGRSSSGGDIVAALDALPDNPAAVPPEATASLTWRGVLRSSVGNFSTAAGDLVEIVERMQLGLADVSSGAIHATLARSQWFSGQWTLAALNLRLALDLGGEYVHPLVAAIAPLQPISDGDFVAADAAIADCHALLDPAPWLEGIDNLVVTEVIRLHAEGGNRPDHYPHVRNDVLAVRDGRLRKGAVWLTHAALSAIWARELADAEACAAIVRSVSWRVTWGQPIAEWLHGLIAEARGQGKIASSHLRAAIADGTPELPLYRAHMLVDHARLAVLMGDTAGGAHSLQLATAIYTNLGARPWLARVLSLRPTATDGGGVTINLSDKERDIVALVTAGLSYAQIARQLFITQSTVSYHLGNIYAKTDVGSRHQLTALARETPALLGLVQPAS